MFLGGGLHIQFPAGFGGNLGLAYDPFKKECIKECSFGFHFDSPEMGKTRIDYGGDFLEIRLRSQYTNIYWELVLGFTFGKNFTKKNYKKIVQSYLKNDWEPKSIYDKETTVGEFEDLTNYIKNNEYYEEKILSLPLTIKYFTNWDGKETIKNVIVTKTILGQGEPNTIDYINLSTKKVTLSYKTEEDKIILADTIIEELKTRKIQKERLKNFEYDFKSYLQYPYLNMSIMGFQGTRNPELQIGQIYLADMLTSFYVINRMNNGEYNIGQHIDYYSGYQFIMKNSTGNMIRDYVFADTALFRYLGRTEVISGNGYVRFLPYFEMLKIVPRQYEVQRIIDLCKNW